MNWEKNSISINVWISRKTTGMSIRTSSAFDVCKKPTNEKGLTKSRDVGPGPVGNEQCWTKFVVEENTENGQIN